MPPPRRGPPNNRPVSFSLGSTGRYANSCIQAMATVGLARSRGVEPRFNADWVYRRWLSMPDEWFTDDLTGTIDAQLLARQLPPAMRPYLQDLRLWANVEDEVRAMLQPSAEAQTILAPILAGFAQLRHPLTFIHVRRGDTVTRNPDGTLNPLPASYYMDAASESIPYGGSLSTVVFSDDQEWCKENMLSWWPRYEGVPGPEDTDADYATRERTDWIDPFLMASCDRAVISNSSYGWLGAWLGNCETWYPSRWFGPKLRAKNFDERFIIPKDWNRVQVIEDERT